MNLSYYFCLFCLLIFGALFAAFDLYIGKVKEVQSNRLLFQSKVYLDSSIDNATGLLQNGVTKARIALLLNPENLEAEQNYLKLLFRTDPVKALIQWSESSLVESNLDEKKALLLKCIGCFKEDNLPKEQMRIIGSIALGLSEELEKNKQWMLSPSNALIIAELLAEVGHAERSLQRVKEILRLHPDFPDAVFLATKVVVHLGDKEQALNLSRMLAELSSRRNQTGVDAIKHMTLLNLLQPLSQSALTRCIEILKTNSSSNPIDFLRIYALLYVKVNDKLKKNEIISHCSTLFNHNDHKDLLTFSNWLAQLGAFEHLVFFLPYSKAKIDEDLFKLRMGALAKLGDLERIGQELNDAPIIPLVWRLVVETRALSLSGKFSEARKSIDTLMPLIENDPRKVRSVCLYLENVDDITSLSHLLEKLIEKPIHQKFALDKLIEHRSSSANLSDLISWLSKLQEMRKQSPEMENAYLYFRLLDNELFPSSPELLNLLRQAEEQNKLYDNKYTQISLALAHLRNDDPSMALVSLGEGKEWRNWTQERPAWAYIASKIYLLNHDQEKADLIYKRVNFKKMDKAEKESLANLFSETKNPVKD